VLGNLAKQGGEIIQETCEGNGDLCLGPHSIVQISPAQKSVLRRDA